jgi:molecular chaperone DnaK (HSP70)
LLLSDLAVGIDLGTTFSVVGINKNGKVIIIEDKQGRKIFPSVVSYLDNGGSGFAGFLLCLLFYCYLSRDPCWL